NVPQLQISTAWRRKPAGASVSVLFSGVGDGISTEDVMTSLMAEWFLDCLSLGWARVPHRAGWFHRLRLPRFPRLASRVRAPVAVGKRTMIRLTRLRGPRTAFSSSHLRVLMAPPVRLRSVWNVFRTYG